MNILKKLNIVLGILVWLFFFGDINHSYEIFIISKRLSAVRLVAESKFS